MKGCAHPNCMRLLTVYDEPTRYKLNLYAPN